MEEIRTRQTKISRRKGPLPGELMMGGCFLPRHLLIWDISDDQNCPKQRGSSGEKKNELFLGLARTVLWIGHKRSPKCNASFPHGTFDEFWSHVGNWEGAGPGMASPTVLQCLEGGGLKQITGLPLKISARSWTYVDWEAKDPTPKSLKSRTWMAGRDRDWPGFQPQIQEGHS